VTDGETRAGSGRELAQRLSELFSRFSPRLVTHPLQDFSMLHTSTGMFCEVAPSSAEELCAVLELAYRLHVPIRVQGQRHALNGSGLPRPGELCVQTSQLATIRFSQEGTVTAGAGIVLWALRAVLNVFSYTLPVVNLGYAAPTVGGFIAGGGFGDDSARYGGFWENVESVTLISGRGNIEHIRRHDPVFPWIFGAMGQLGVVADATLDIIPFKEDTPPPYPHDLAVPPYLIRKAHALLHPATTSQIQRNRLYWWTLFVAEAQLSNALAELAALEAKYADHLTYREPYQYFIRHIKTPAPLLYPYTSSFFYTGSWNSFPTLLPEHVSRINSYEVDFMNLVQNRGYHRYIQTEIPFGPEVYTQYFAPDIMQSFRELKRCYDPASILNRDSVFSSADSKTVT
jgi:FAD/FMN-containing dehydrogenase